MVVLIPSYEPTDKLIKVITEINENTDYSILIVDDGNGESYKHYFDEAEILGCKVLHHSENRGKGEALKTGFKYMIYHCINESVVCADSDGQHTTLDIIKVAKGIDETGHEMVLGVRKFKGKVPLKSRVGNSITTLLFNANTKMRISDTQTGLRGYPFSMIPWLISIEGDRFEYEFNLLLKAKSANITVKQIPIVTVYENNNKGTHFNPIKDSIKVYIPLLKFGFSSFSSAIIDFTLLFVFQAITNNLFLSVVMARVISSAYNYSINKLLVFKAKSVSETKSAPKYFGLVIVIMLLNYLVLLFMTSVLFIPTVIAKILTEMLLFILSYTVQKKFVFKAKNKLNANDISTH